MQKNLKLNEMKEYKVFTLFKPQNGVKLEVWLEDQLNRFSKDGWQLKNILSSDFQKDALGLVILEKEIII